MIAAIGAALLLLGLSSANASAATFCVNEPPGDLPCLLGTSEPTIQDALDDAATNNNPAVKDFVRVGSNSGVAYDELLSYTDAEPVHLLGVGAGEVVIDEAADSFSHAVTMLSPGSTIENVTIRAPDISNGAALRWDGTATDIEALHTDAGAPITSTLGMVAEGNALLEDSRVDFDGFGAYQAQGATGAQIRDTTIQSGGTGVVVGGGESVTVRRSTIVAARTVLSASGGSASATLENVLLHQTNPLPADNAIQVLSGASAVVNHATVDGTGTGRGAGVDSTSADATLTLSNSIIDDFATALICGGTAPNVATLGVDFSNWTDPTNTGDPECTFTTGAGNTSVAPQYVSTGFVTNFRLRAPSPLIDAGEPGDTVNLDRDGLTRPIDGDGADGARTDIGAYEYQRQAPAATLNGPSAAAVGQPVAFTSTGTTDPDPGDALDRDWSFGDGGTATGVGVQHTYSTPGTRTVTLTVTDPTGLVDTATKQITVSGGGGGTKPSNEFGFRKARKNKRAGTAVLVVALPGPGNVELARSKKVKGAEARADAAGDVRLTVKPKGKAKAKLKDRGKAKVIAQVTFTPDGGEPNTESTPVKLKLVR